MSELTGILIGHETDEDNNTGCTVFLCPEGTIGGVDVRGPAPGSRETEILSPYKRVNTINAVLLSGGAAFGLAAADGVVNFLSERNIGHQTLKRKVPIVSAAVVNDMLLSGGYNPPGPNMGYAACQNASNAEPALGNVGAGTGTTVGKWHGFETMMKGGFGYAENDVNGLTVFAAAVTNCVGDIVNDDGTTLAGARSADGTWLSLRDPFRQFPPFPPSIREGNTTLIVVGTNALMTKVEANRLAQRAHDGMAIAVRPVHTSFDGDAAYALATCSVEAPFDLVANVAVVTVAEAIRCSVRNAASRGDIPGLADH
ncbi:MAG: P1 family peptidase [Candidatus Promineifilaceae bacterium]